MNSKMKMTLLAGALALAVGGQANAAILAGTNMANPDLILSVWDTTSTTSYTVDLGITVDQFLGGAAPVVNSGASFVAGNAGNGSVGQSWTADATLTSFLAGISANSATTYWNVTALDNTGIGANGVRVLTTTNVATVAQPTNTLLTVANLGNAAAYYDAANLAAGTATDVTAASPSSAYAGGTQFADKFGGKLAFSNMSNVGVSQNFWFLSPSSTSNLGKAQVGQFASTAGASTWTLASNGTLTYAVAAVPEPGEWLLMLSGLCLVGFIATRRKNAGSMTFA